MLFKKLINYIYNSEINCRIEWAWDGGFTWSIQDNSFPRIWKDDNLDARLKAISKSKQYSEKIKTPIHEADWIARGNNKDIDKAFSDMFDAIIKHFPNSSAAIKLKDFYENKEHFAICAKCGDLFDCRDLGDVFSYEHNDDIPVLKKKNPVAKKKFDIKMWNDGKSINLN